MVVRASSCTARDRGLSGPLRKPCETVPCRFRFARPEPRRTYHRLPGAFTGRVINGRIRLSNRAPHVTNDSVKPRAMSALLATTTHCCALGWRAPLRSSCRRRDHFVNLHHTRLAGFNPKLVENRHQRLAELVERRLRLPHIKHHEFLTGAEGRVIGSPRRMSGPGLLQPLDALVVFRGAHPRKGKVDS
jgi:hypothetical protein